ncbi:MAG TPA: sigma-70 family RNA polymerase sigma factor [bacterium]|nr:sigma-70 family RNA polymerase sigma factor [bacterium]
MRTSPAWQRELRALDFEHDAELRAEGLLSLASRIESRGEEAMAAEIYGRVAGESFPSNLRERAERRLAVLSGEGPVGDRVERGFRHFFSEATDPAALAAMAAGGLAFRATRLAVVGRLAASPNGWLSGAGSARLAASLAGFAVEAPVFTLSAKLGHQTLGRAQDWSGAGLGRELAASYLFLGALRLSGAASTAAYRRVGGTGGSPLQSVFTQAGIFTGILGAHALEVQAGLAPRRDGASVLVDSLVLQLQFHVAGRLSQGLLGEGGRRLEREWDSRAAAAVSEPSSRPRFLAGRGPLLDGPVYSIAVPEGPEGFRHSSGPTLPVEIERPAAASPESPMSPRSPSPEPARRQADSRPLAALSSLDALRKMLREATMLPEAEKREVIRRIQAGDQGAKNELLRSEIRYVHHWVRAYGFRGQELLDAMQEGQIGLLEAAQRFDFRDGVKFESYGTWWIRSNLTDYASHYLDQVRLPAHQLDMLRTLRKEIQALQASGAEIEKLGLAERLDISPARLEELRGMERSRYLERIDAKRGSGEDEGYDLHEILPDKKPRVDEQLVGRGLSRSIERFIASRPAESDRVILQSRLLDPAEPSRELVAARLGSTAAEVKGREARLLYQLRVHLESQGVRVEWAEPLRHPAFYKAPKVRKASASDSTEAPTNGSDPGSGFSLVSSRPPLRPRVAIVGFGMAGVGAANALRNFRLFSDGAQGFEPRITVFEGMNRTGGKAAPDNLGAQFVDAEHFYPIDRMIREHELPTTALRHDYDLAPFVTPSGIRISGHQFSQALRILRQSAREALSSRSWEELDRQSAVDFIRYLGRRNGPLSSEEVEAMVARLGFEEGTLNISALSYAINLAKSQTPMPRYEIVGGMQRLAEAELGAILAAGGEVRLGTPVRGAQALADGIRLSFNEGGRPREESFDYAILALAPEHLRGFEISGTEMPVETLARLEPAHIRKTNLRSHLLPPTEESANPRFARWNSPDPLSPRLPMVTFFHGWNGEQRLTLREMMLEAYGREDAEAMIQVHEQVWDGRPQDGIPHYYTTMPAPGQGYAVARFAMDQYFGRRYDAERLRMANHTLGLGCYVRDAAIAGELAALSLLRGAGLDLGRSLRRRHDPHRELLGADKIR